jgi:peptidoglycan/LPS O-acetylase OafA/YrhL
MSAVVRLGQRHSAPAAALSVVEAKPKAASERLVWLDLSRVVCAIMILGIHWLHASYNVGLFGAGAPVNLVENYQYQNVGWHFFDYVLIGGTAPLLSTWLTNIMGLLGGFGWEAVSALIVISGFSLAISQRSKVLARGEWLAWFDKRARRILIPFYLIALPFLAVCAIALLVLPHLPGHVAAAFDAKLHSQFHTHALGAILSHTILIDPWGFEGTADFVAPAWWFVPAILVAYMIYPLLRGASRVKHGLPLLAGAAVVSCAAFEAANLGWLANETWYYIALQELFNFSLGIVLAQVWLRPGRATLERVIANPGLVAAAFVVFVLGNVANWTTAYRPFASMLYGPSLVLMIVYVSKLLERTRAARALTSLDPYDLYLVHQPFAFPIALAAKLAFHSYAVFVGWFAFLAVAAAATKVLTAAQQALFRAIDDPAAFRRRIVTSSFFQKATAKKTFVNIQGLRAIAALAVFGLHLNVMENRFTGGNFLSFLTPIGNWGVDLFFVISGFVMITSTWNEFATPGISWRFLLRRITRIYPPYLALLIPIALIYFKAPQLINSEQAIRPNVIASFLLLPQQGFGLLIVAWTLVYEMFFYAVFAVVLMWNRRYCLPLIGAWAAFTLIASVLVRPLHNIYLSTYTSTLLLEFIFGVAAGYFITVRGVPWVLPSLALGIAGLIGADFWYVPFDAAFHLDGYLRFAIIGIPTLLVFIGVVGLETRYHWTFPAWMVVIGNASYSLYLWHEPLTVFVGRLSQSHQAFLHGGVAHAFWLAAVTLFVVAASIVVYYAIERPLLRAFSRRKTPDAQPALRMHAASGQ